MNVLVIVPAYNEEANIVELLQQLKELNFDILVINDGSRDKTSSLCRQAGIRVIDLPFNLGIGGAVQTGYKYASANGYDLAIQVDGDGQHNTEYLPQLVSVIERQEADMVIGSRFIDRSGYQSSPMRRLGIFYFSQLLRLLTRQRLTDPTSGFRACNKKVIQLFANYYPSDYPEPETLIFLKRHGIQLKEVPVRMNQRAGGLSSITPFKSVYYMVKVTLAMFIDASRPKAVES
jgi:glycosyltransferase involved in cell wall biosynthesis